MIYIDINLKKKGWKKIIIAQGPRQIIAGFTVYAILSSALIVDGIVKLNYFII